MKGFTKLLISDFKQFLRDKTATFFTFAFPILIMLVFGLVFSGDGDIVYNIGVSEESESQTGAIITSALDNIPLFEVSTGSFEEKHTELEEGTIKALIIIPEGIDANIAMGQASSVSVYYDPSQKTSSQIILSVLGDTLTAIDRGLTQQPVLLELEQKTLQTQSLRNIDYLVPGVLGMSVMFLGLFSALPLVEWREKKILKRFGATPVKRSTMILSQIVYRLILAILQAFIILFISYFIFDVNILGNMLELLGIILLGTLAFISIGYFAVSRVGTTEGALPIIQLIQFPMLFLSGIFFPVEIMPEFMRPIVDTLPLTYLGDSLRQVMVNAAPLHSLSIDVIVLGAWLVVCTGLTIRLFKWE